MKTRIKQLIPAFLLDAYYKARRHSEARRNRERSPREVFSEIYRRNVWGTDGSDFYSGTGSADRAITEPYVLAVRRILLDRYGGKARVVDLGCGDFVVGSQLATACAAYVGLDVVPELIEHLQANNAGDNIEFACLDITRDALPAGDVCLIRQVFQHLSNEQVGRVLKMLGKYDLVIVTEHYPGSDANVAKNLDKVHGGDIRLLEGSGVYLDAAPFDIPSDAMTQLLQVPGHDDGDSADPGVIRTFAIEIPRIPKFNG